LRSSPSSRPTFADLARRISSVTANCLVTLIVLVAGLGFGRQVLVWWKADSVNQPVPSLPAAKAWDDPRQAHLLEFGQEPWSVRRQSIAGERAAAVEALRATCRELTATARLPDAPAGKSESELLARLARSAPLDQQAGQWSLYQLQHEFPIILGARCPSAQEQPGDGEKLAATPLRVVTWGLAIPAGPDTWTLYTFQSEQSSGARFSLLPEIPLPPDCRRTLSARTTQGVGMVSVTGPRCPETWAHYYDQWFTRHRWQPMDGWQRSDSGWRRRYRATGGQAGGRVDVWFGPSAAGGLHGLLVVSEHDLES